MKIIHLSDLHFGTQSEEVLKALDEAIHAQGADLVIISGDFTQVGSSEEFILAHKFLNAMSIPYLAVPGNHDIPALNIFERFFTPYKNYKKYIDRDLCPSFENHQVVIVGMNSARRILPHWNWANGAISKQQRDQLRQICPQDDKRWKIAVLHHPVHKVHDMPINVTVFGRKRTLQSFKEQKIDLILTGHVHHASITTIGDADHQSVYLSASTALSSRKRSQENGFNVITLNDNSFTIDIYALNSDEHFEKIKTYEHARISNLLQ